MMNFFTFLAVAKLNMDIQKFLLCLYILDFDECAEGMNSCHSDAVCTDTDGSFTCQCKDGFSGSGVICKGQYSLFIPISSVSI